MDCSAVTGALSVLDQYHLGSVGAEYAQQKSKALKLAVVGTPPVIDEFAAIVASNRGITAKVFRDTTDAVAWLRLFARGASRHDDGGEEARTGSKNRARNGA